MTQRPNYPKLLSDICSCTPTPLRRGFFIDTAMPIAHNFHMPHYATIRLVGEYAEILKALSSLPMPAESLEIFQEPAPLDADNPLNKIGGLYPSIAHKEAEELKDSADNALLRKLSEEESQRVRQRLSKISHESLRDACLHAENRLEKMFQGDLSFCK